MSRSGASAKIRANATSSAPYSWLTVQMTPTTPIRDVSAAPRLIASTAPLIRSARGGNASIRALATRALASALPAVIQPATPSTSSVVGMAAKSAEKERPLASSPPAACP
jgi:hypothetical protein